MFALSDSVGRAGLTGRVLGLFLGLFRIHSWVGRDGFGGRCRWAGSGVQASLLLWVLGGDRGDLWSWDGLVVVDLVLGGKVVLTVVDALEGFWGVGKFTCTA